MDSSDMQPLGPQNFLYGCELKAGKEVAFSPAEDEYEHQLSLRMVCVDSSTKDELHVVEVEGRNTEGQKVKAVLATVKPSSLPSVCLGGFEVTPPAVFRLKCGSGPVHISGQHLVMMDGDQSFDDEEEEEEEEEEVKVPTKRPAAPASAPKAQKKMKVDISADDDEDDDDDEDEDDEEDDEDEEEEEEESEDEDSPVKVKTPSKPVAAAQNGKTAGTPSGKANAKSVKTPEPKGQEAKKPQTPKSPQTPRVPLSVEELKAKMMAGVGKGVMLPKIEAKFVNYLKNGFRVMDDKVIQDLWKWRQTVKDRK